MLSTFGFNFKLRRYTVATSRQGMGVTGGTPYGFQAGAHTPQLLQLNVSTFPGICWVALVCQ